MPFTASRDVVRPAAGDNFSPNPGSHAPMGANGICPKGTFNPFVACDSGGECGSITGARYNLPGVQTVSPLATTSGPDKQKYYSFNYGGRARAKDFQAACQVVLEGRALMRHSCIAQGPSTFCSTPQRSPSP